MLTDAHCHPYEIAHNELSNNDLVNNNFNKLIPCEILASSSACDLEEFLFCENIARNVQLKNAKIFPCFGIHPQIFAVKEKKERQIDTLEELASTGRICAVGEIGFDLYNAAFRETEALQDKIFLPQAEIALKNDLPVVLHVRRAMHKIFALSGFLTKCKAVVFHSWPGTLDEATSLLRRGINCYFSFGNTIMLNHKQAVKSCALLPAERLLTETDAPYQPRRGEKYSCWNDLPLILKAAAALQTEAGKKTALKEMELQIERNFCNIFK